MVAISWRACSGQCGAPLVVKECRQRLTQCDCPFMCWGVEIILATALGRCGLWWLRFTMILAGGYNCVDLLKGHQHGGLFAGEMTDFT